MSIGKPGLQWQIMLTVGVGLVVIFSVFGLIAWRTIEHSTKAALRDRLSLASVTAQAVDDLISHAKTQLDSSASFPVFVDGSPEEKRLALQQLRYSLASFTGILALDSEGNAVAADPEVFRTEKLQAGLPGWAEVAAAIETGSSSVFRLPGVADEPQALAFVVSPVMRAGGSAAGALLGELRLTYQGTPLVSLSRIGETGGTAVVDSRGMVLKSSWLPVQQEKAYESEHATLVAPLIREHRSGHVWHRSGHVSSHVVTFVPLEWVEGGIIVEDREDVVLAVPDLLRRQMLIYGSLALGVASLGVWVYVSRMVGPLRHLADASQRIAEGRLEEPVDIRRGDEIGVLARRFESMRQSLLAARQQQERWELELEGRVRERTHQVHTLLDKLINSQEEERKRLARELHDQTSQDLATVLMELQSLTTALPSGSTPQRDVLERGATHLERAIQGMRTVMMDLRPSALDDLGLVPAIRWYAQQRTDAAGLRLNFQSQGEPRPMGGTRETATFRILQEAIVNAVRHSQGHRLEIRLEFHGTGLSATVKDDGQGFDPSTVTRSETLERGWGLIGMEERASLLGGQVHIDSAPGRGTRVQVEIPYGEVQSG